MASQLDVGTALPGFLQPSLDPAGHELRAVVAAQPLRFAARGHQHSSRHSITRRAGSSGPDH